jgi:2'-5' RNA ligase
VSNLVIVAIPDENDRVWKVSSEEIPHLTICFLGDSDQVANLEQIVGFVEHAATQTLKRFHLPVDRRGELGNDPELGPADVLFFKRDRYDYKAVRDFRAALLQDDNIRTAYDSATQHEGVWVPHLTLGYENRPAKPDEADYGFYDVGFNKVAVWIDNYDGPEFLLKDYWDEWETMETIPMDVSMSDIRSGDLEHYGVKGMRWGFRKEDLGSAARAVGGAAKTVGKAAARGADNVLFESAKSSQGVRNQIVDKASDRLIKSLPAIKEKHGEYGKLRNRAKKPFSKEARAYRKDVKESYLRHLETSANEITNFSGSRRYTLKERGKPNTSKYYWDVETERNPAKHAVGDSGIITVQPIFDDEGYIVDIKRVEDSMSQTIELGADFLAHYGVKGMRWGIRRDLQGRDRWSPEGHSLEGDVAKALLLSTPFGVPASYRLGRRLGNVVADNKWKKDLEKSTKKAVQVHNTAADEINKKIASFNGDKRWAGVDLNNNPAKKAEYDKAAAEELLNPAYARAAVKVHGEESPGGRYKLTIQDHKTATMKVTDKKLEKHRVARHAAGDDDDFDYEFDFAVVRDDNGHITGFEWPEDEAAHTALDIGSTLLSDILSDEALAHYGVKGMRWGFRREAPSAVAPTAKSVVPHGTKRKTQIKVDGGENHPAHGDAVKVAQARAKLGKSGAAALSNAELREVANRLQLEQQVKQLTTGGGKKFVTNILRSEGQQGSQKLLRKGVKGARKVAIGV